MITHDGLTMSAVSPTLRGLHGPRLGPCRRAPATRWSFYEEIDDVAHRALLYGGFREWKVVLNDVPVAAAVGSFSTYPASVRSLTIADALRSVILSAAAMLPRRTFGSCCDLQ